MRAASRCPSRSSRCTSLRTPAGLSQDGVNAAHAIGERRGARLQDLRGLDLVKLVLLHGRDSVPAGTRGDALGPEFLAAPGADDDVGIAPCDLAGIGDRAPGCGLRSRELREDIFAAGDLEQLAHP